MHFAAIYDLQQLHPGQDNIPVIQLRHQSKTFVQIKDNHTLIRLLPFTVNIRNEKTKSESKCFRADISRFLNSYPDIT